MSSYKRESVKRVYAGSVTTLLVVFTCKHRFNQVGSSCLLRWRRSFTDSAPSVVRLRVVTARCSNYLCLCCCLHVRLSEDITVSKEGNNVSTHTPSYYLCLKINDRTDWSLRAAEAERLFSVQMFLYSPWTLWRKWSVMIGCVREDLKADDTKTEKCLYASDNLSSLNQWPTNIVGIFY